MDKHAWIQGLYGAAASIVLAASVPASGVVVVPAPPLKGYLCDEISPGLLIDNYDVYHATLEGGASLGSTGPFPYAGNLALLLDGSDDRAVASTGHVLSTRTTSSVSAWFKFFSGGASRQFVIYSERDTCDFNVFWVGIEKRPFAPNGLTFAIFDGSGSPCGLGVWNTVTFPVIPSEGVWHHVAATLHPGAGMKLYFDGALVAAAPMTAPFGGAAGLESTIGHAHTVGTPTYWLGSLDDIALFDYALTDAEVMWLFTHPLGDLPPTIHSPYCFGDGSGTACPCGNDSLPSNQAGCRNSFGGVGTLRAYGNAKLSADTLSLAGSDLPITWGLYFQGETTDTGGAGTAYGDGLRCVLGPVIRLGPKYAAGTYSYMPEPGDPTISVKGLIPGPGVTRHYQLWYRDTADFCDPLGFNFTNAVTVIWGP